MYPGIEERVASKENAGTCLPKSGGTLTGDVIAHGGGLIGVDPEYPDELLLKSCDGEGALLSLRTADNSRSGLAGSFLLRALVDDEGNHADLLGKPDGSLTWCDRKIESFYFQTFTSAEVASSVFNVLISWTVPSGWNATVVNCWTNGWVGGAATDAHYTNVTTSAARVYWTNPGAGTVSVLVMFHR